MSARSSTSRASPPLLGRHIPGGAEHGAGAREGSSPARPRIVAEAQAKVCGKAAKTALDEAQAKYPEMQRLVPGDQLEDVNRYLDKRATLNPDGLRYDDFVDARAHTTDRLRAGDVESTPVTRGPVRPSSSLPPPCSSALRSRPGRRVR